MNKVLVTGAAEFVERHMVKRPLDALSGRLNTTWKGDTRDGDAILVRKILNIWSERNDFLQVIQSVPLLPLPRSA